MKCERCENDCILCPENYPWNEDFWICSECGSTYIFEFKIDKDLLIKRKEI